MPQRAVESDNSDDITARLQRLYREQLYALRAAERQAHGTFPDLAAAAADVDVTRMLESAAAVTEIQLARLDGLLEALRLPPGEAFSAVDGAEVQNGHVHDDADGGNDRDARLLRSARQSLRQQISGYESACATARRLGDFRTLDILLLSLDEELATDSALSDIVARHSRLLRAI